AEAAGGDGPADRPGLVRSMDAIERRAKIERPGAKGVVRPAFHAHRQAGPALAHLGRRHPARPFRLSRHLVRADPVETRLAHADAIATGRAARLDKIEVARRSIDDDRAGRLGTVIRDYRRQEGRIEFTPGGC